MVSMMRSGIMRLEEGGSPWYINIFGSQGEGETAEEKARREFLGKLFDQFSLAVPAGQENYDPFAGDEADMMQWTLWWLYNQQFPGEAPEPGTETGGTETGGTETGGTETDDGSNRGGLFGLGIGPFLSDLFGVTGTGVGNVLSGIFGQGGNISDLIELFLKGKAVKGAWDAIEYEVPTGQKESMSDFEKANPLTTNMTLAGIRPSYLQNQKYAIPVGQSGIPAATHTVGTPFVEKVEEVQGGEMGGIMGAKGHGDIVPALLEPNEFVFTRKAVQNMGNGNVNLGAKRMYKIMKDLERMG
tara:strand:- start:15804 stop:16703 length:900 start_codon:yes stop_codon:yes gene_type:complete